MTDPRTGYAATGELQMYYEVHGSGPPVVLLHGAYMSADAMAPLRDGLLATRQVIVPEMEGHGRTADADRPLSYEQMADDVAALIRELGAAPADVVGYSMGAGIGLQLAIRHPEAVRRLVIISASARRDGMQPEGLAMFPTITPEMFAGSPMEDAYKQLAPDPARFPELVRKLTTLDSTPFAWPEEEVRGITAPTLIMVGDSDVVTVEHAVELYRLRGGGGFGDLSGLPVSQLAILPGTTHFIPEGHGILNRLDWLVTMIPPFLDAEASAG
jgi:pimeloyl-ACP methyl ester carboxylesterase